MIPDKLTKEDFVVVDLRSVAEGFHDHWIIDKDPDDVDVDEIIKRYNEWAELKKGISTFLNQPTGRFIISAGEKDIEISKGSSITLELDIPKELQSLKEETK